MSRPDPSPEPRPATVLRPRRGVLVAGLLIAWVGARAPWMLVADHLDPASRYRFTLTAEHAVHALTTPAATLIEESIGVSGRVHALLRDRLGERGRLVLFMPYDHEVMVALLRSQYERLKNLLYPEPRDAAFAQTPAQLAAKLDRRFENELVVVDGTQEDAPLPVGGRFELLTEQRLRHGGRVRYWLLREAPR